MKNFKTGNKNSSAFCGKSSRSATKAGFSNSTGIISTKFFFFANLKSFNYFRTLSETIRYCWRKKRKRFQNSLLHVHRNNLRKINFLKSFLYLFRLCPNIFGPPGCRKSGRVVKTALSVSNGALWGKFIFGTLYNFSPFSDNVPHNFEILAGIFRHFCQNCVLCFHRNSFSKNCVMKNFPTEPGRWAEFFGERCWAGCQNCISTIQMNISEKCTLFICIDFRLHSFRSLDKKFWRCCQKSILIVQENFSR